MRPVGEISLALLGAVVELRTDLRGPTLRDLALHAQVGLPKAAQTMKDLKRHGHVRIARKRRVDYVNKPVAEYDLPEPSPGAGFVDLGNVLSAWLG